MEQQLPSPHFLISCSDDEFVALLDPPPPAALAPLPLLISHVDRMLSQIQVLSTSRSASCTGGSAAQAPQPRLAMRLHAEALLRRSSKLKSDLAQLKGDVMAWVRSAMEVKPKELDVEQAVKRVVEKLSDMGATSNSSGASGSIARGTPAYLETDITSLSFLLRDCHMILLVDAAFDASGTKRHRQLVVDALRIVRDHHVAAVGIVLNKAFDFHVGDGEVQNVFKFEGLESGLFEKKEVVSCVKAQSALNHVLATLSLEDDNSYLRQSWFMQGCALAWSNHWLPFEQQISLSSSSHDISSDLSHAQNTPWSVRYARSTIIEVAGWLDTLSYDQPSPLASASSREKEFLSVTSAQWLQSCDNNVFIKFVCEKVKRRIQQQSETMMFGSDMQLFAETLDACCDMQKNIFDICGSNFGSGVDVDLPSALVAFCEDDDMFETWMYIDAAAADLSWAAVTKCSTSDGVQRDSASSSSSFSSSSSTTTFSPGQSGERVRTSESDCFLGAVNGMMQRASLIPSSRHRCNYVKSIISPFFARFHQTLSRRLENVLSAASVSQSSVAAMMVLLAATTHVVRMLRTWDVVDDSFAINGDAEVNAVMVETQSMFAQLKASVEDAVCNAITSPFMAELPDVVGYYTSSSTASVFSTAHLTKAAAAAAATGTKALQLMGLRSKDTNQQMPSDSGASNSKAAELQPIIVSPLISRILDSVVHAITACVPLCDAFTFRMLILKISEVIDAGYLQMVVTRVSLLTERGSKQMQADAQSLLDAFRAIGGGHLPVAAAVVKLLALDLVSKRSLLRQLMGASASSSDVLTQRGAVCLKGYPDAVRNMLVTS